MNKRGAVTCATAPFLILFPQPEQYCQQCGQAGKVGTDDQQCGFERTEDGPEFLLAGPFAGLFPRAVVGRIRGSGGFGWGRSVGVGPTPLISAMVRPSSSKESCFLIFRTGGRLRNGRARPHAVWELRSCSARWRRGSGCGTCSLPAGWPGTGWSLAARCVPA